MSLASFPSADATPASRQQRISTEEVPVPPCPDIVIKKEMDEEAPRGQNEIAAANKNKKRATEIEGTPASRRQKITVHTHAPRPQIANAPLGMPPLEIVDASSASWSQKIAIKTTPASRQRTPDATKTPPLTLASHQSGKKREYVEAEAAPQPSASGRGRSAAIDAKRKDMNKAFADLGSRKDKVRHADRMKVAGATPDPQKVYRFNESIYDKADEDLDEGDDEEEEEAPAAKTKPKPAAVAKAQETKQPAKAQIQPKSGSATTRAEPAKAPAKKPEPKAVAKQPTGPGPAAAEAKISMEDVPVPPCPERASNVVIKKEVEEVPRGQNEVFFDQNQVQCRICKSTCFADGTPFVRCGRCLALIKAQFQQSKKKTPYKLEPLCVEFVLDGRCPKQPGTCPNPHVDEEGLKEAMEDLSRVVYELDKVMIRMTIAQKRLQDEMITCGWCLTKFSHSPNAQARITLSLSTTKPKLCPSCRVSSKLQHYNEFKQRETKRRLKEIERNAN